MRTASDTIRDSEILADNLLTIMQPMTYQEEKNIKLIVTNTNPIPTNSPNVTTRQKNKKSTSKSKLKNDVDDSLKKCKLFLTSVVV